MPSTTAIRVTVPKQTKERLSRFALQYGFSLQEFSRHILEEVTSMIATESIEEYEYPQRLRASLTRALRDWRSGRVQTTV